MIRLQGSVYLFCMHYRFTVIRDWLKMTVKIIGEKPCRPCT